MTPTPLTGLQAKQMRKALKLTAKEVAQGVGCIMNHWYQIESGSKTFTPQMRQRFRDYIEVVHLMRAQEAAADADLYAHIITAYQQSSPQA